MLSFMDTQQNNYSSEDILELIEPTPVLQSKKCRLLALLTALLLQYTPYMTTLYAFFAYDAFIAFVTFIFSYLVVGIIRSKMRLLSLPRAQFEMTYTDKAIATWYVAKRLCYENLKKNENFPSV